MVRTSRKTKQKELLSNVVKGKKGFFNAEELHELATAKDSTIGIATIYRYLSEAVKNKELKEYLCNRRKIYSKKINSHCHYTCEETGKTWHFEIDNLDFLKDKVPGTISTIQLEIKGICNKHKTE